MSKGKWGQGRDGGGRGQAQRDKLGIPPRSGRLESGQGMSPWLRGRAGSSFRLQGDAKRSEAGALRDQLSAEGRAF